MTWIGVCVLLGGCFGNGTERVYPVSGHVQLDGKPLAEATIVLHPVSGDGRSLTARTDGNGRFEITSNEVGDGAPVGAYTATVEYRELVQEGDEAMRVGKNLLPPHYADSQTSGLHCEVKAEPNEFPVWNLKSH